MPNQHVFALVRHGDYHQPVGVPSALLPYALNKQGIEQATLAAAVLQAFAAAQGLSIAGQLHSSMQQRAWQTANIIAQQLGAGYSVQEYAELSERSVGAVANLTVAEIEQLLQDDPRYVAAPDGWKSDSHYCLPFQGAESLLDAGKRVAAHIDSQLKALANEATPQLKVIVGHGAAFRHACVHLQILDLKMVRSISMHHARPVFIRFIDGCWQHVGGEWKPRKSHTDGDEIRER